MASQKTSALEPSCRLFNPVPMEAGLALQLET